MTTTKNVNGCYRLQRRRRHQENITDLTKCKGLIMGNWGFSITFNNGFGLYLGTLSKQAIIEHDEDGDEILLVVHGFELLLPFISLQLLEIIEYEG